MTRQINFKCIVDSCNRNAAANHAICNYHLFVEITLTFLIGLAVVWGAIYAILGKSQNVG